MIRGLIFALAIGLVPFQTRAQDVFEFVGVCSWGPKSFKRPEICEHVAGNALAKFFVHRDSQKVFVVNELVDENLNFCRTFDSVGLSPALEVAAQGSSLEWSEPGDEFVSNVSIDWAKLGAVQASTQSQNFKQFKSGLEMTIYAPCFFVSKPGH